MSGLRPFVLAVLDGWGESSDVFGNAIAAADTPTMDRLRQSWPWTTLAASGEAVGLPEGQQGNSEVGHLTIGAGRVIYQPLTRINRAIRDGSFFDNPVLVAAVDSAVTRRRSLHCLGLVSPGGVHSNQDHAVALVELARRRGLERVYVHAFTDGRDEPPASALGFMRGFVDDLHRAGCGRVASVVGRYWAMDRDTRWDRTQRAYDLLVGTSAETTDDPLAFIEGQYVAGVTDEFLPPVAVTGKAGDRIAVEDGDSIICFNFRPDRARQLSHALVDRQFTPFQRTRVLADLHFVTFTEYERDLPAVVAFPREDVKDTLAELVSNAGLRQFHVAETEKYAHVTYFINGGREEPFSSEDRELIPSPRVDTYDSAPAMSAQGVTDAVVDRLESGDAALIVLNFANPDMVGHTGVFDATIRAVEEVDRCLARLGSAVLSAGGGMLITADHGNAERKIDPRDDSPLTAHTTSRVPAILVGGDRPLRRDGGLRDVAPTVLAAMGLEAPTAMTGRDLVEPRRA